MVEAIVPRDRNGLVVRLLFLVALLGVGGGVLFKATQSNAATTDMTIALADSTAAVADAGEVFNFTIDVSNTLHVGPTPSGVVIVQLRFDQGTALIGPDFSVGVGTGTNWSCSALVGVTITCTNFTGIADATAGPTITIPITVQQTATAGRLIRIDAGLNAQAWPEANDAVDQNHSVLITRTADLAIAKGNVAGTYIAGDLINWPITVTNLGPSAASPNIRVTDTIPAGLVLDSVAQPFNAGGGFMCSTPAAATASGVVISCVRTTMMGLNEVANLAIPFRVGASTPAGVIPNTAAVCTPAAFCFGPDGDIDANAANDSATGNVTVGASFDLGITKTANLTEVTAGSSFIYTINTTGAGATPNQLATINDVMTGPAGGTYSVVGANGWVCTTPPPGLQPFTGNAAIACNHPALPAGASNPAVTITVNVPADSTGGTFSNSAGISGANPDPNQGNNAAGPVEVDVIVQADIQITKCAVPANDVSGICPPVAGNLQVQTGEDFIYRIIVRNAGPSAAPAGTVSVGDSLPSQIAFRGNPLFGPAANTTDRKSVV